MSRQAEVVKKTTIVSKRLKKTELVIHIFRKINTKKKNKDYNKINNKYMQYISG